VRVSDEIPEWALKAARQVYGRLIFGNEMKLDKHEGLQRQHDEEKIRGCARIICQCRKEAIL
jgi:hypothetical protein